MTELEKVALSFVIKDKITYSKSSLDTVISINGENYISVEAVIDIIRDCEDNFIYQSFVDKYKGKI